MVRGVSVLLNLFINHASCIPSLSCLPLFLYPPYMPLFNNGHDLILANVVMAINITSVVLFIALCMRSEQGRSQD